MQVKVIAIDDQDRVKLSRKALLREQNKPAAGRRRSAAPPRPRRPSEGRPPRRGERADMVRAAVTIA